MAYIRGEAREQTTMFPVSLDEQIPADHMCRVIEAFVGRLNMAKLGFGRAEPSETGRPGYDPRDLLKLYLYGYLQQVRSSRRLEAESRRNVEVMWLLGRLQPDYKSIAEFRRMHSQAVTAAGAELVRFARSVGLVRGETVAVDGSLRREDGHLPLSGEPDPGPQTTFPQGSRCVLCEQTGSVRCLCPEGALYEPAATLGLASSA
jgi:transposase